MGSLKLDSDPFLLTLMRVFTFMQVPTPIEPSLEVVRLTQMDESGRLPGAM